MKVLDFFIYMKNAHFNKYPRCDVLICIDLCQTHYVNKKPSNAIIKCNKSIISIFY